MDSKPLIDEQVTHIATRLNLPFSTVKKIIKSYIRLLENEIYMGMEVRVGYILSIVPKVTKNNYLATTGYEASLLEESLNVPYNTVLSVLTLYLDMIIDSIKNHRDFDIVGLVNLNSVQDESTGETKVYANISRTITDSLKPKGMSVRVKLNINLRHLIKTGVTV